MKITNIYPKAGMPGQTQVGNGDTIEDVLEEIRLATFDGVVVVPETHQYTIEEFHELLDQDRYVASNVQFLSMTPIKQTVHVPAQGPYEWKLVRASDGKPVAQEQVPAQEATTKEIETKRYCDFATKQHALHLASKLPKSTVLVVIWEPYVEAGDLNELAEFQKRCPDVHVVIYHRLGDRVGVVVEGDEATDSWDTKTDVENEKDLPPVIEGIAHEGESNWFGALPKVGKTWVLLCILLALLTGLPLFGDERLTVPKKAKRCIYLCPEASRGSIKKRLKMLGLIEHLYDPITNPEGRLYLQTLSKGRKISLTDPMLLELAKGADIFIDTAVRYLEGDENAVKDVRVLTENILNLLAVGARSVWVAHHAPKGFENASTMTLQNMFRGSGEFGAALTNAYGLCTEDEATTKIRLHCICGRDLDEPIPDMILQGRPYLFETGNFKIVDADAAPRKAGAPADTLKQEKIDFLRTLSGSNQEKAEQLNTQFGSKHDRSTVSKWLKESASFDSDQRSA